MPRKKKPDTTETNGSGTQEGKQSSREAVLQLVDKLEREIGGTEADAAYTPGTTEVYGTFINFLKSYAGDDLGNITEEGTREAWEKAFHILAKFVRHMAQTGTPPETLEVIRSKFAEIAAAGAELFPGMEEEGEVSPPIPHTLTKAETYVMPTSKAAKYLTQIIPDMELTGQLKLLLYPPTSKKAEVRTVIGLTYEGPGVQLRSRHKITKYDQAVHNAISSLWEAGNRSISPQEIFRTMNGNADVKVKAKQAEKVDASVNKLMFTRLTLDMSADIKEGGLVIRDNRVSKGIVETQLLQATIGTLQTNNGKTVRGYILSREPMLYTYSKAKKHVLSVDASLLDTSSELSNTDDVIVIREYLLQQVENMRHGYRDNTVIDYSTIEEATGIDPAGDKVEQHRFRETVKKILSSWKKKGYILDYIDHKAGRTVKGVKIILQQPAAPRIDKSDRGRKQ